VLPRSILPPSYEQVHGHARRIELASDRRIRERNKISYRLNHWPIWIFVFFIAPGPMTFTLFEHGFNARMAAWMAAVLVGTGIAGLMGKLPGVEPRPYIIRFTEDRPNPIYRRICYTMAWSEAITFAVLNIAGLVYAIATGEWRLRQFYEVAYFPLAGSIWALGALATVRALATLTASSCVFSLAGLAGFFALDGLHHGRRAGVGLLLLNRQVAQHGVVELEGVLQFSHHGLVGFDVHAQVVGLGQLVDQVRQLTAAPVFYTVHLATASGDHALVALQHGWNLLALIRMDQQNDFVMTHAYSFWVRPPTAS